MEKIIDMINTVMNSSIGMWVNMGLGFALILIFYKVATSINRPKPKRKKVIKKECEYCHNTVTIVKGATRKCPHCGAQMKG